MEYNQFQLFIQSQAREFNVSPQEILEDIQSIATIETVDGGVAFDASDMACSVCNATDGNLAYCGQCSNTIYCGAECQRRDWPQHHQECIGRAHSGGHRSGKKWIQKTHMKEGSFTAEAKRHHMSPAAFQKDVLSRPGKYSARTKRRANLRKTLVKM